MTDAPADPLVAEISGLIADAEALQGVSRTEPDAWLVGKDGLVTRLRGLRALYDELRGRDPASAARLPKRTTAFRPGVLARRGRIIPVERRRAR